MHTIAPNHVNFFPGAFDANAMHKSMNLSSFQGVTGCLEKSYIADFPKKKFCSRETQVA